MPKGNVIKDNLPRNSYLKIGEKAGVELGRAPLSYNHVYRCINNYPVCPWKDDRVYSVVIRLAFDAIKEAREAKQQNELLKAEIEKTLTPAE